MKIFNENCIQGMKKLKESSIDLIVTDPPYGLKFMDKKWDKTLPPQEAFQEMIRILKPGAFAFVMCTPRSDLQARMSLLLEDAGFNIRFTPIYWTYATGFPKATNISKQIDKRKGAKRKVIGEYQHPDGKNRNWKNHNQSEGEIRYGHDKGVKRPKTEPATDDAIKYNGAYAGYQPKPAVEVIIVAMKPRTEKTYVDQALANGHGITWLDDCRIPVNKAKESRELIRETKPHYKSVLEPSSSSFLTGLHIPCPRYAVHSNGRFPSNLLVSDDSLNNGKEYKSGNIEPYHNKTEVYGRNSYNKSKTISNTKFKGDSGSYSRYFDLDAWFAIIPKASPKEKNYGLNNNPTNNKDKYKSKFPNSKADKNIKNTHPTVKPIKLMSYLITLGSRPNQIVLDPFMGSGTTGIAAQLLNRKFIGYEQEPEYYQIAKTRIHTQPQPNNTKNKNKIKKRKASSYSHNLTKAFSLFPTPSYYFYYYCQWYSNKHSSCASPNEPSNNSPNYKKWKS